MRVPHYPRGRGFRSHGLQGLFISPSSNICVLEIVPEWTSPLPILVDNFEAKDSQAYLEFKISFETHFIFCQADEMPTWRESGIPFPGTDLIQKKSLWQNFWEKCL